jgi:hypothetical protein
MWKVFMRTHPSSSQGSIEPSHVPGLRRKFVVSGERVFSAANLLGIILRLIEICQVSSLP